MLSLRLTFFSTVLDKEYTTWRKSRSGVAEESGAGRWPTVAIGDYLHLPQAIILPQQYQTSPTARIRPSAR